jgi:hypothetical protein
LTQAALYIKARLLCSPRLCWRTALQQQQEWQLDIGDLTQAALYITARLLDSSRLCWRTALQQQQQQECS